ncbi:MAG: helicase C-terminal domain-containing protein, partial [Pirellulales bacterium]
MSEVCIHYIDADIYILDEFQRFKELVNTDEESEVANIAQRIFGKQGARILLLSATPFKAYTGNSSWDGSEEHYQEFLTILRFLFNGRKNAISGYEHHRRALFKQLLDDHSNTEEIDTTHRDAIQDILRRVMCRTERLSVSEDFNAMTRDKWRDQPLKLSSNDINSFVATDNIVQYLNEKHLLDSTRQLHAPIEFCKSAPFPLSFLDDYRLKNEIRKLKNNRDLKKQLETKANSLAWINHREVKKYGLNFDNSTAPTMNAKLDQVLQEVLAQNGDKLLWVPPSLPCYPLEGAFADSTGFSKTLIFSAWLMVPRMLSSLISYEVERRTIGQEKKIKYFHEKNEKRHPIPQLVFSQKKAEASKMSNFTLLYPSQSLASAFDPNESLVQKRSLDDVRKDVVARCNKMIKDAKLHQFVQETGEPSKWYWAAPLLLDRHIQSSDKELENWLESPDLRGDSDFFDEESDSSKTKHFEEFVKCFHEPNEAGLGRIPEDLGQVLADMAIASPAVSALRCVSQQFQPDFYDRTRFAFNIANEFLSLFNKPESIAAVRLCTERPPYWRRVLRYCVDGCMHSMLEEFFHILKSDCPSIREMYDRLADSINLRTAFIKVDDLSSFLKGEQKNMRCHYAIDLGNQRMETDDGKERIKSIRQNFNSPFRPFVLSTTSIGQEGLDFHSYCRKIIHWNLPSNPIDLEQREGRINRFKGLAIRQHIASKYRDEVSEDGGAVCDIWDALFQTADKRERGGTEKCELIPYWHVESDDQFKIERIIPFYPFSRDRAKLTSLLKTLALYRLAFGQPRQSE